MTPEYAGGRATDACAIQHLLLWQQLKWPRAILEGSLPPPRWAASSEQQPPLARLTLGALPSGFSTQTSFFFKFIYFLAVLCLRSCARSFSSCGKQGPLFTAVRGPLTAAASLVAEHRLQTRRLSSRGSRAQLLRSTWDLP